MISEVTFYVIDCDARDCGRKFTASDDMITEDETREEALREGWVYDGGDLCPEHSHLVDKVAP